MPGCIQPRLPAVRTEPARLGDRAGFHVGQPTTHSERLRSIAFDLRTIVAAAFFTWAWLRPLPTEDSSQHDDDVPEDD